LVGSAEKKRTEVEYLYEKETEFEINFIISTA